MSQDLQKTNDWGIQSGLNVVHPEKSCKSCPKVFCFDLVFHSCFLRVA